MDFKGAVQYSSFALLNTIPFKIEACTRNTVSLGLRIKKSIIICDLHFWLMSAVGDGVQCQKVPRQIACMKFNVMLFFFQNCQRYITVA